MFEKKFTEKAASVLHYAEKLAKELSQSYLGSEHLLYGLLREKNAIAYRILLSGGLSEEKILSKIQEIKCLGNLTEMSWRDVHPIPDGGGVFETVWRDYREGKIYE